MCVRAAFWFALWSLVSCGQMPRADESCSAVEILVGFGIGGGTDTFSRTLAQAIRQDLGMPVQVVNITAGSGRGAFRELMKRPADGCTLLAITSDYLVLEALQPEEIDLTRLTMLARAHAELGLLSARHGGPGTWQQVVDQATAQKRRLLIGGTGAQSFDRTAVDIAMKTAGVSYRYIPYNGTKEMQTDLFGGRLDAIYDEYGVMKPLYEAGVATPLLVLSENPPARLSPVPASTALGLSAPPSIWRGIAIHKQTPANIIERLRRSVMNAMQMPVYRDYEASRDLNLLNGFLNGAEFQRSIDVERRLFQTVIQD